MSKSWWRAGGVRALCACGPRTTRARGSQVQYRRPGSHSRVVGAFSAEDVRRDYTDRS